MYIQVLPYETTFCSVNKHYENKPSVNFSKYIYIYIYIYILYIIYIIYIIYYILYIYHIVR